MSETVGHTVYNIQNWHFVHYLTEKLEKAWFRIDLLVSVVLINNDWLQIRHFIQFVKLQQRFYWTEQFSVSTLWSVCLVNSNALRINKHTWVALRLFLRSLYGSIDTNHDIYVRWCRGQMTDDIHKVCLYGYLENSQDLRNELIYKMISIPFYVPDQQGYGWLELSWV